MVLGAFGERSEGDSPLGKNSPDVESSLMAEHYWFGRAFAGTSNQYISGSRTSSKVRTSPDIRKICSSPASTSPDDGKLRTHGDNFSGPRKMGFERQVVAVNVRHGADGNRAPKVVVVLGLSGIGR
jgi:hypothetical protein